MTELSIIIATLESPEDVEALGVLESQDYEDYEVLLQDEAPVTAARNEGIRRATSEKLIFLDDDSRPAPGYLATAAEVLETEAAYAGRTIHPYDDMFARHFTAHYDWGPEPRYVDRFWGCNMGVRREVFDAVGGWDEAMGWGHEEKELADRVRTRYKIRYHPDLVVRHPYSTSIREYWRKQYKLERNASYYWTKQNRSHSDQIVTILAEALDPTNYVRRSPLATLTQVGAMFAKTAGRIQGLLEVRRERDASGEVALDS